MTGRPEEFLVLGGGIGGLVAALALARQGRRVRVLERAPEFTEVGAGLQVGPNASRVLDRLGVLDAVTRTAFFPRRLILRDAVTGEPITALDTGKSFVDRFGHRYFVAHRADLHQAILAACKESGRVELSPSKEVIGIEPRPGGALVRCADGSRYDTGVLIGADGLHSLTRKTVVGDGPPVDSGYVAYRGTVPMEQVRACGGLGEPDGMVIWVGPSLHLVQYPVRRGELCNQVATFDTRRYGSRHDDLSRQLDHAFTGMCPAVVRGVSLIDRSRRWPMLDRPPVRGWSAERLTLVGDAAHPMLQYLAQGACQAIEDSVVLADCVAARPGDTAAALKEYEALRGPRTARVQTTARQWGDVLHIDGVGAAMRGQLLSQRDQDDFGIVEWLYGYDPNEAVAQRELAEKTAASA
ncbi:MAG TPA: FAD-dependent monooxygenase [Amycolatopsis sp.]|nr:FAD-dependent monooxygenase [Amycolatopsis sp.]